MDELTFDPNAFILPANKEERKRLASAGQKQRGNLKPLKLKKPSKRALRKLEQLKRKEKLEATREEILSGLQKYRLTTEISERLASSTALYHKKRKGKLIKKEQVDVQESSEEEQDDEETRRRSEDDDQKLQQVLDNSIQSVESLKNSNALVKALEHRSNEGEENQEFAQNLTRRRRSSDSEYEPCISSSPSRRSDAEFYEQNIHLERTLDIEKQRSQLPAVMMEQEIVDLVINNDVSIISGDTGCGKSTQVPQFLYESGLCGTQYDDSKSASSLLIGITQPRRVAVTSICHRVGTELNNSSLVGYQVRYDKSINASTCKLKFMTDGILLKELQGDFLCSRYAVLILDEAHERSVNSDILIGLLSRAVLLRRQRFDNQETTLRPLRVVIMSATLRVSDFTKNSRLFAQPPPVLRIDSHTYPVTLHFAKRTDNDYINAAANKIMQIHKKLPTGSILAFVTGRKEVHRLCSELKKRIVAFRRGEIEINDSSQLGTLENHADIPNTETSFFLSDEEDEIESSNVDDSDTCDDTSSLSSASDNEAGGLQKGESYHISETKVDKDTESEEEISDTEFNLEGGAEEDTERGEVEFVLQPDGTTITRPILSDSQRACKKQKVEKMKSGSTKKDHVTNMSENDQVSIIEALGFDSGNRMGSVNPKMTFAQSHRWLGGSSGRQTRVKIVPLYALLSNKEQSKAFELPKDNERVIIVSTNVAETSLTLPNIRYVVDCGREKKRQFLASDVTSVYSIQWVSKASADQRAGRAGRIAPGHCYRLYSSAVYLNTLPDFPTVNLFLTPLDSVLLFMSSLGISNIAKFPFPNPPPQDTVQRARSLLLVLGALQLVPPKDCTTPLSSMTPLLQSKCRTCITPLGRLMSKLPIAPRFSVMLIAAMAKSRASQDDIIQKGLVQACAALVSGWSVGNLIDTMVYESDLEDKKKLDQRKFKKKAKPPNEEKSKMRPYHHFDSDVDTVLWIVSNFISSPNRSYFCRLNHFNHRQLSEATSLYHQLLSVINKNFYSSDSQLNKADFSSLPPSPTAALSCALHDCALLGLLDNIAGRCDLLPKLQSHTTARSGYYCSDATSRLAGGLEPRLFIHKSSAVCNLRPRPNLIAFAQINTTNFDDSSPWNEPSKRFILACFPVDPIALSNLSSSLISVSDFLSTPGPIYSLEMDEVVGFVKPKYLPLELDLPSIKRTLPNAWEIKYRVFAKALLEGNVIFFFKKFHNNKISHLQYKPSWLIGTDTIISKPTSEIPCPSLNPALSQFVKQLKLQQCTTKRRLIEIWQSNSKYLIQEFCQLLSPTCPESLRSSVLSSWPPSSL